MVALGDHSSSKFSRIMYIGDSGTGKTGSLTSLVADGYKIRVLDMDNGLDVLKEFVRKECPAMIGNVDYETRRDKFRATKAGIVCTNPTAMVDALGLMAKWSDDSDPSQWGPEYIFVLDSLSAYGRAAYEWARQQNPLAKDPRQWYHAAQQAIENMLALLTSEAFATNVIVISHVNMVEVSEGVTKGYANSLGKAQGPIIPRYFNTMVLAESSGMGKNVRRKIKTVPTGMIDLKSPVPFKLESELPLETGMSTLFKTLKETD